MTTARQLAMDTLSDAERYLMQAVSLPDSIEGRRKLATHLRIAVIFSWVALEEQLRLEVEWVGRSEGVPVPEAPYERLILCLAARQLQAERRPEALSGEPGFSPQRLQGAYQVAQSLHPRTEFQSYQLLRESLAHGKGLKEATACVAYCRGLIAELAGPAMLHTWTPPAGFHAFH